MNSADDQLVQRLRDEQERLTKGLEQLKMGSPRYGEPKEGSPFGKKEEEAASAVELEKTLVLEERLLRLLAEVQHALAKVDAGTYGSCDICGEPIGTERLEALPQAHLCLSCKAHEARGAKGKLHFR